MEYIDLIDAIDSKVESVRTRSLDLSFNELLDMYDNEELIISPEYQRLFRWDLDKQSRFIESLILELPIPPIFVIELKDGQYELIDGLQRISTYLHFRGELKKVGKAKAEDGFELQGCDVLNELNGREYDDLPKSIQIKLKRNFIRVEILRKESDSRLRYYMFKRLNTGGEILSEQEVRNCTIRLLDSNINDFIIALSKNSKFSKTISKIQDKEINKMLDQELVLRFFALKNNLDGYYYPFDEFLTEYMESVAKGEKSFNYQDEKLIFDKTFSVLNRMAGDDIFSNLMTGEKAKANFVTYYYEALTLGIQKYLDSLYNATKLQLSEFAKEIVEVKQGDEIGRYKTGSKSNILKRIGIIEKCLEKLEWI